MRTDEVDGGQAGAVLTVRNAAGQVVAFNQTPPNPAFPGGNGDLQVVAIDPVPRSSNDPDATDTVIVSVTIPNTVPDGSLVTIEGVAQYFDVDDISEGSGD